MSGAALTPQRSPVLDQVVRLTFHTVVVLSLFLLFAGHNAPGGGFIGGLLAGAALVLRYVAAGDVERSTRIRPEVLLGAGLLLAGGTGLGALVTGDQFLESWTFERDLPLLETVKFTAALPFDIGVYLIVIGLMVAILDTLGRDTAVRPADTGLVTTSPEAASPVTDVEVRPQPDDRPGACP